MGLGYTWQNTENIVGSRDGSSITTATLESSYASSPSDTLDTGGMSKVNLNIRYSMGDSETSNSLEIKVSTSPTNDVYHQIVNESTSGGTSNLTVREFTITGNDGGDLDFSLPLDVQDEWMKFEFKESGVSSNKGSVFCEATLSGGK